MKEKERPINSFPQWIELSQSTLGSDITDISKKFYAYWLCIQTYIENGKEEKFIEIRLDDVTKLSCHFVGSLLCDMCFLFPDKQIDVQDYIGYLNNGYDYDFLHSGWILSNSHIRVRGMENEYYFMFNRLLK